MSWKLFLDDERFPPDYDDEWVIARNFEDAMWYVESKGVPNYISFDHDLGLLSRNGHQFAKTFTDYVWQNYIELPEDFMYRVHSMNPVGAENIRNHMKSFLKHYEESREATEANE